MTILALYVRTLAISVPTFDYAKNFTYYAVIIIMLSIPYHAYVGLIDSGL